MELRGSRKPSNKVKKSILTKILEQKGITKEDLKKEREENLYWPEMDKVVEKVATEVILAEKEIVLGVLYDVDVDGLMAGYTVEDYFTRRNIKVVRYMNTKKQHGLVNETMEWVKENDFDWLFIVDAGSGDQKQIREITDNLKTKVVVLDHHPYNNTVSLDRTKSWVLNVQDKEELPKLSGAGVTYRFIEKLGNMFGDLTGQYQKFVGITVLSDMCDLSVKENRYYLKRAYEEYRGNYFLQQFPYYGSGKSFYSFGVIPYLNACIRVGEEKHAMDFINNMNTRYKMNAVERDRRRVLEKQKKMEDLIRDNSKLIKLPDNIMLLRKEREELRPVSGLVANKLMREYQRPVLVLHREGEYWVGSFRGNYYGKDILEREKFSMQGHDLACGVKVKNTDLKAFAKQFKYEGTKQITKATFATDLNKLSEKTWKEIAEYNEFAGQGITPILIRIKNGVSGAQDIEEVSKKKKEIIYGNKIITDFTGKTTDTLIVEPILRKNSYQLIRA